jgi:hypothetical protein
MAEITQPQIFGIPGLTICQEDVRFNLAEVLIIVIIINVA